MIPAADTGVGAIYDTLRETGMYENTVFIFSTDNGGAIENISNLPLRVSKHFQPSPQGE